MLHTGAELLCPFGSSSSSQQSATVLCTGFSKSVAGGADRDVRRSPPRQWGMSGVFGADETVTPKANSRAQRSDQRQECTTAMVQGSQAGTVAGVCGRGSRNWCLPAR